VIIVDLQEKRTIANIKLEGLEAGFRQLTLFEFGIRALARTDQLDRCLVGFSSLLGSTRHHSKLLHERHSIVFAPMFHDLAVGNAEN
jgi:hypothetical protein